jgi:hypothetical protein
LGPFLSSGSSGASARIIYHRKAVEVIQACLFATFLFQMKEFTKQDFFIEV